MTISADASREERIRRELNRLKRLLKGLTKEQLVAADGLLKRISFMSVTLEDLEIDINANGETEPFTQGGVTYDRQRPSVTIYNATIKNYTQASKQLFDLMPAPKPDDKKPTNPFERLMKGKSSG